MKLKFYQLTELKCNESMKLKYYQIHKTNKYYQIHEINKYLTNNLISF